MYRARPLFQVLFASQNAPDLEAPLDSSELDRAFAEAEAEVDSMHGVNDVAERVLMDERVGFAELAGDELAPIDAPDVSHAFDVEAPPDTLGMDAAFVEPEVVPNVWAGHDPAQIDSKRQVALATLETWLQNLERRKAGRAS